MEEGDQFFITVLNKRLTYEVDQIQVVEPEEVEDLAIEKGKDYVTLVTCTPYAINTHRLLVRGSRIEYVQPDEETMQDSVEKPLFEGVDVWCYYLGIAIGLVVLGVGITAIVIVRKRRKKRMGKES